MRLATAFNIAIALIEGREADAKNIAQMLIESGDLDYNDLALLSRRLEESVSLRCAQTVRTMLKNILKAELTQEIPETSSSTEARLYFQGKSDLVDLIETEIATLDAILKPRETDETVDSAN